MSWKGAAEPVRNWLYGNLPRPRPLLQSASLGQEVKGVTILSRLPNPTFSYYFEERVKRLRDLPVSVRDLDADLSDLRASGMFVIIVRYIKPRQLKWLIENRDTLSGLAFFVDDDMASIVAEPDASWFYKRKLCMLGIFPLRKLNPILSHVWASSAGLAAALQKDAPGSISVLAPYPSLDLPDKALPVSNAHLKIVYHATGIHIREHDFLRPVVASVLADNPQVRFEVIADGAIARRWREARIAPEQLVINPTSSWPDYLAETRSKGADIALVPLLDGRTNAARSDTKRVDVARLGAAGVFSRSAVFSRCSVDGEFHIPNEPDQWIKAINSLIGDQEKRHAAAEATRNSLEKMVSSSSAHFPFAPQPKYDPMTAYEGNL